MALFFLLGAMFSGAFAQDSKCEEVRYSQSELFQVMAEVEGPRGSLRFPAILDTGASRTLIPASIMEGIGYSSSGQGRVSTAGGEGLFDTGTVQMLSFLGMYFPSALVYVDKPKSRFPTAICRKKDSSGRTRIVPCEENSHEETGIIGMSELSQTSFEFKDGVLKVCNTGGQ